MLKMDKFKKPNFITRWFNKKVSDAIEDYRLSDIGECNKLSAHTDERLDSERRINFTVHSATGGVVIETGKYDTRTDRFNRSLYIISSEQDLGHEISKIITLESLK